MHKLDMTDLSSAIRRVLGAGDIAFRLYDTVDSTNSEAKRNALTDTCAVLYIARTQTGGRGRLGRSFHSPADTGLYMTLAYTTHLPLPSAVRTTALAAVATVSAVEALTDKRPRIKWVNDIYINGGKLAGILTEAVTLPCGNTRMLAGIGVNLTTATFPADLRAPAASLFEGGSPVGADFMGALAGEITRRLLYAVTTETLSHGESCLNFYRRHLLYVGERVLCTRGHESFEGTVLGVNDRYGLVVEHSAGVSVLDSGEISVRPLS